MSTPLILGLALLLLAAVALWAVARARRIRAAARQREEEALARLRGDESASGGDGETVFEAAGLPSRMPMRQGIEVAEHDEVVDLEALLAGEPQGVARRARATLEEPTNISLDLDTLPPRPSAPAAPAAPMPVPASPALAPSAAPAPIAAPQAAAAPVRASAPPVLPAVAAAPQPSLQPRPVPARAAPPSPPTLVARLPTDAERAPVPVHNGSAAGAVPQSTVRVPAAAAVAGGAAVRPGAEDVPLRELTLAWFEARGYRGSPASAAVRPIEQVLRHRHDPARAYAFVVEDAKVSAERVQQLRTQARSIGLLRVLIVANAGADEGAATKSKGVRLMDRSTLAAEFDQLDFSVSAKIIAVARKRAAVPSTAH